MEDFMTKYIHIFYKYYKRILSPTNNNRVIAAGLKLQIQKLFID